MVKSIYYGNLQSFKFYLRPVIFQKCGSITDKNLTKHQRTIQTILKFLAQNDASSTWEIAKKINSDDLLSIKSREKEYRRLFLGRKSGVGYLPGLLDTGLVLQKQGVYKNRPAVKYRLSIYGILYCIDGLKFSDQQIDQMLENYKYLIPRVFEKWDNIKKEFEGKTQGLKILAKGILFDFGGLEDKIDTPLYELANYLNVKYRKNYDYITEKDLAEQVSYWFYSYMLFYVRNNDQTFSNFKWFEDDELKKWFLQFGEESKEYFSNRVKRLDMLSNRS